jgi:hypothetical protein
MPQAKKVRAGNPGIDPAPNFFLCSWDRLCPHKIAISYGTAQDRETINPLKNPMKKISGYLSQYPITTHTIPG